MMKVHEIKKSPNKLSFNESFRQVPGLGAEIPCVLVAKAEAGGSYRRARYKRQQATIKAGKVFREMRKSLPGFIRFGILGDLVRGDDTHPLNRQSIEPYDFISRGNRGLYVFHDERRICIVNLESGEIEDTITYALHQGKKMELYNVHTVQYHPDNEDFLLISVTGLDRVIEMSISTRKVLWQWCPWHHGMHTNGHGLTIVDRGDVIPDFPEDVRIINLDAYEAEKIVSENRKPSHNEAWIHRVDLADLPARLGLQKWERVKLINSAYYADGGNKVMITFWQTGEAICVDRLTGEATFVARNLGGCPHSFIEVGALYYLTDTCAGRVIQFDSSLQPTFEIDFTQCPLRIGAEEEAPEWLQNTHPITNDLLATFDFRRSRVIVWNFEERIYSEYLVSDEWVLQCLKNIHPSSLEYFKFESTAIKSMTGLQLESLTNE